MNNKQLAEAKIVNQAFKEQSEELHKLGQELSGMQTFLAAILNTFPNGTFTVTKPMIDELHARDLCEIEVKPMPDRSFILTVCQPALKPEPKLIISPE